MLSFQSIFSQAPSNGQIAHYEFNNGSLINSINSSYNGTYSSATQTIDRYGNSNSALLFSGNSYVLFNYNNNLHPNHNEKTYMFWAKFNNSNPNNILVFQNGNADLSAGQFRIELNSSGKFLALFHSYWGYGGGSIANNLMELTSNNFDNNVYHQVAFTISDNIVKYFLDGDLVGIKTWTLPYLSFDSNYNFVLGGLINGSWSNPSSNALYRTFNGVIDNFRIYNRALTENEILQTYNYENNTNIPTNGLVAFYPFNNNANDEHLSLNPSETTINNGTVYGATPTTDRFGNCDKAYSFNGVNNKISTTFQQHNIEKYSMSFWLKLDNNTTGVIWDSRGAESTTSLSRALNVRLDNNILYFEVHGDFFNVGVGTSNAIPINQWVHFTTTFDGINGVTANPNQFKIYRNGILEQTTNQNIFNPQNFPNTSPPFTGLGNGTIGFYDAWQNSSSPVNTYFNGKLDDIRIYNTALTQQQVTDLYNAEKPSNAGTNYEAGITVLVHGFQFGSGTVDNNFDFAKMGHDILQRAGGGVMYKNNKETGQLEILEGTFDSNKEIVLVYDWWDLSSTGVYSNNFGGNGYLESAGDNLFATILKLANPINAPMSFSLQQFLNKPKHLIGHSRGTILLLQTLHRFANYFPNTNFEQVTFLDGHPATPFGDMVSTYNNSPLNLPGVLGSCTNCYSNSLTNTGCDNTTANLMMPFNVLKADTYHRQDGQFEGLTSVESFGSFDGLPIPLLGNFDRELDNNTLSNISTIGDLGGGAHSKVHKWYRATIDTNIDVTGNEIGGTDLWFSNGIGAPMGVNNFMFNECRSSTGFAYSRIGGKYNDLPLINPNYKLSLTQLNQALAEREGVLATNPNGIAPHNVFNGDFHYNNSAGWIKNGGTTEDFVAIASEKAIINQSISNGKSYLKHSLMYFGGLNENYKYLKLDAKKHNTDTNGKGVIRFHDENNNDLESFTFDINILGDTWKTLYIPIPNELKPNASSDGKIGSFSVYGFDNNSSVFEVDNFELINCTPISNNLYVAMPDPSTLNFADIDSDHWAKEGIYKSRNYGLFRGTSPTTFTPNTSLTKAEAITVLVRAGIKLGIIPTYNTTGLPYADVTSCNQYFPYIQTAKNLGHLEYTSNFSPNDPITVAQLCVYMDKILQINLHDWNTTSPNTPWVLAPTSQYIQSQLSQIVINQPEPSQNAAMRRILHCIDVVKNDNIIDSYRTQNVWTLKDVENINISNGQPVEVDGTATVTRARMAVASANLYRFVYKKLNNGNAPAGRLANQTNTTTSDPSIDDFIGIGNTFDNKDVPATDTPEAPTQITFNINSGETLNLQYQSDTDTAGNPQFFYWSMNKNVDSNIANLVSVPINSIQNHRKVSFIAPVITTPKTWYLYSYLANNKGKIKETVITINVSSTLSTNNVNGILDNVKIYPNPTDNILFIDTLDKQIQKIELFDLQGRLLKTINENKEKYQIDISNFSSATYLVKLSTEKGNQTVKVVKK